MKAKIFLWFLFVCVISPPLCAQQNQKLDSLLKVYKNQKKDSLKVNTLAALYNTLLYNDPAAALKYAQEEYEVAEEINYKKGMAMALYHIGAYYSNHDEIDSAKYYYNQSLKEFEHLDNLEGQTDVKHGLAIIDYTLGNYNQALKVLQDNIEIYSNKFIDSTGLAVTYDLIGTINTYKGNHNIALAETLKALKILEKIDKPIRKADALNHLAAIEFYLGNYDKSIEFNQEALQIYKENNDKYYEAQALNDIGNTYHYKKEFDQAIAYLEQSLALSRQLGVLDIEATALGNLGKTHVKKGQYEKAILLIEEGLKIVQQTKSTNKVVEAFNDLGMAYSEMNEPTKAISYFNKSIVLADSINVQENLRIGHYQRSLAFAKLRRFDKAYEDHVAFKAISDSIYDATKSQQIEELRTIYETEKKEQQISLQEQEIKVLEQQASISNLQRLLMAVGLLFSVIAIYALRQKMKRNKLEREKVDAELAFKKKELTTHALNLARKNEVLETVKQKAAALKLESNDKGYKDLIRTINFDQQDDRNWENFIQYFEQVHKDFSSNIKQKYPEITSNELRLLALLKMNLSSKEIASILNISSEGIKKARYRLRKKLDLTTEDSLQDLVLAL